MSGCTETKDKRFAGMSAICAFLVVCLHGGVGLWGLVHVAVPWFFFAAGYFFAKHVGEPGWWMHALSKRLRTLLIPFALWVIVEVLFVIALNCGGTRFGVRLNGPFSSDVYFAHGILKVVGIDFFVNMGPLWFVRMLFLLVVFSPLVVWGLRKIGFPLVIGLFGVYLLSIVVLQDGVAEWRDFWEYGISLRGIAYFSAGIFFRFNPIWLTRQIIVVSVAVVLAWIGLSAHGVANDLLLALVIPAVMIAMYPGAAWAARWSSYSFPVYLMHMMLLMTISCGLGMLGVRTQTLNVGLQILRVCGATVLAMGITYALRKYFPWGANCLFGGR